MAQPLFLKFLHLRKKRRADIDQFKMEAMPGVTPSTIDWGETIFLDSWDKHVGGFLDAEGKPQRNWKEIDRIWRTTHTLMTGDAGVIPPLPTESELFDSVPPLYLQIRFRYAAELYHIISQEGDWKSHPRINEFARVIYWMLCAIRRMREEYGMNSLAVRESHEMAISERQAELIRAGVSANTLKAYGLALGKLAAWLDTIKRADNGGDGDPLDDVALAAYLTHLHDSGKAPSTIAQVVAAVKWRGLGAAVGQRTTKLLAGIRREGKDRGRGQVDGLVWNDVVRVCAVAEATRTLAGLRDSAMINLMSDCLLRISEVVAVNVGDVKSGVLHVRSSKTDQTGKGEALYICESTRRVLRRWLRRSGIERGALFRRVRYHQHLGKGRLSVVGARDAIKRWAHEAGVKGFISGHSLRVGSAVSLARAGASVVDMQTAGRWGSPSMPAHYAKAELAERGAIARFKDGK